MKIDMKYINILISCLLAVVVLSCEEPDYGAPKPSATVNYAKVTFVNAAPNTTAWCETLEGFLNARKFKLTTRVGVKSF